MTMKILLGADPELFVTNAEGKPRSAHGLVPGTKEEPYKVNKGAVQVDGMALEFNIDPAATEQEFVDNIAEVMRNLRALVSDKYDFLIKPSVRFNGNHMRVQPEEAKELGCSPDFNVYTMADNPRPNGATTLRTASGHIHIGFTEGQKIDDPDFLTRCATLTKHLDVFLGLPSLKWDKDATRRQLYGRAGTIRVKPYGLEYRVLSNMWLKSEDLVREVYSRTMACVKDLMENGRFDDRVYSKARDGINSSYMPFFLGPVVERAKLPQRI